VLTIQETDVVSIALGEPVEHEPSPDGAVDYPWVARTLIITDSLGRETRLSLYSGRGANAMLRDLKLVSA